MGRREYLGTEEIGKILVSFPTSHSFLGKRMFHTATTYNENIPMEHLSYNHCFILTRIQLSYTFHSTEQLNLEPTIKATFFILRRRKAQAPKKGMSTANKQKFEQCHPYVEAILSLPKICSPWITINIHCDLIQPWKGMHDNSMLWQHT